MNQLLENPTLLIILLIAITVIVVFTCLAALSRFLNNWLKQKNDRPKDTLPPRDPETRKVMFDFDKERNRWVLLDEAGKPASATIVRGRDTIEYNFNMDQSAKIHFQFPNNDLFTNFPGSVDSWVTTIEPGQTLSLDVAPFVNLDSPLVYYAIFIEVEGGPSGYVKGGSPPKIIVEHA